VTAPKVALCLAGGGITGAMWEVGALAALSDTFGLEDNPFSMIVGVSTGATVAAALAGGGSISRLYRAILDPADDYFPLRRHHLLRMDFDEWRRTVVSAGLALRAGSGALLSRSKVAPPGPNDLWEQLDRFYDSLPAGLFSLDGYERFLEAFFLRRDIPTSFGAMPRALRIVAYDLDSAERVVFGSPGFEDVPVSLACAASMAQPLFFSPVRARRRRFIDGSVGGTAHLDVALADSPDFLVIVNPLVPFHVGAGGSGTNTLAGSADASGAVPTGHGQRRSLRDKGLMWINDQASRIGAAARLRDALARLDKQGRRDQVLVLAPSAQDASVFLNNPASLSHRRKILELAYRTTREGLLQFAAENPRALAAAGWTVR
jgi:NTE family protein